MDLQGNKATAAATHDFLSLYKDSSLPRRDPIVPSQGLLLRTQDFLQPLDNRRRREEQPPDINVPVEHALPGGIGTYSIGRVTTACSSRITAVKSEWGAEKEPTLSASTAASSDASAYAGAEFSLWEDGLSGERGLKVKRGIIVQTPLLPPPTSSSSLSVRSSPEFACACTAHDHTTSSCCRRPPPQQLSTGAGAAWCGPGGAGTARCHCSSKTEIHCSSKHGFSAWVYLDQRSQMARPPGWSSRRQPIEAIVSQRRI